MLRPECVGRDEDNRGVGKRGVGSVKGVQGISGKAFDCMSVALEGGRNRSVTEMSGTGKRYKTSLRYWSH